MHQVSRPLGLVWADLRQERLFQIGVALKIVLAFVLVPDIQQEWFVPFIVNWIEHPVSLPWNGFLQSGGDPLAFPYGPTMFVSHLPTTLLGWLGDQLIGGVFFVHLGFRISLFFTDLLLLLILLQAFEEEWRGILIHYWLSPLLIFITYWHGQTDLIPVALLTYSLVLLKYRHIRISGVMLALSVTAKHSMFIGVPFVLIYLWVHRGVRGRQFGEFMLAFAITVLLVGAPFLFSQSFQLMVLGNREIEKLYWLSIDMGGENPLFITPVIYLLLLYFFWRIKHGNFDLLMAFMGVAFCTIILLTPSPPGWYLWLIPLFALHQSRYGERATLLIGAFSIFFVSYHLLHSSGAVLYPLGLLQWEWSIDVDARLKFIHHTLVVGFGLLVAVQLLREGVRENDYYRLGQRPLALGITGDFSMGKASFSKGMAYLFGERSTVEVAGEDYYNWDRSSPMWKMLTPLDPKANRLFQMVKDVRGLLAGDTVYVRSYEHSTGHFLPPAPRKSGAVVLVTGAHALYSGQLNNELDVGFYLQIDQLLRGSGHRKEVHTAVEKIWAVTEEARIRWEGDSRLFIEPQAQRADVVFTVSPVNPDLVEQNVMHSNLKVRSILRNGIYYQELVRILIGVCGLQVNIESIDEKGEVILEISGDVGEEDIQQACYILLPHMGELLDYRAEFQSGMAGIMQIIALMEIDEALKRRRRDSI